MDTEPAGHPREHAPSMLGYLELSTTEGSGLVPLEGERLTLGRDAANDIPVPSDDTMSRLHAVLLRYPAGWVVQDPGSRNGTTVNGQPIMHERVLRDSDEIRAGATRLVCRMRAHPPRGSVTSPQSTDLPLPDLTRREREVLLQLCQPMLAGDMTFTAPATVRQVADALVVTEAAVKQHLLRLYDKFGIHSDEGERRRVRLANAAVRHGVVTLADLRNPSTRSTQPV